MDVKFTYENRKMQKGDAVTLAVQFKIGDVYNEDFYIDSSIKSELDKMYALMYVYELSADFKHCRLQTKKGPQGKKNERYFPTELFKIVKVPKMADITQWLFDDQLIVYPTQWSFFTNEISSISRFISKIFQKNLKAIYLINKHVNHLYFTHEPLSVLVFYKTMIQQMNLQYHKRYDAFNPMTKRKEFIKVCQELNPSWHTYDAISLWDLNNAGIFSREGEKYISNSDRLEIYKDPKKAIIQKGSEFDRMKEKIAEHEKLNSTLRLTQDDRFIEVINQDVINDLELTIFNVKTIPDKNQILYIFIDKHNKKRYHIADFRFEFYVSSNTSIIKNDYIVPFDGAVHNKFVIANMEILKKLKYAVNDNHQRFMKLGKF